MIKKKIKTITKLFFNQYFKSGQKDKIKDVGGHTNFIHV